MPTLFTTVVYVLYVLHVLYGIVERKRRATRLWRISTTASRSRHFHSIVIGCAPSNWSRSPLYSSQGVCSTHSYTVDIAIVPAGATSGRMIPSCWSLSSTTPVVIAKHGHFVDFVRAPARCSEGFWVVWSNEPAKGVTRL